MNWWFMVDEWLLGLPSGNLTICYWFFFICNWFTYSKWWFSIVVFWYVYQRVYYLILLINGLLWPIVGTPVDQQNGLYLEEWRNCRSCWKWKWSLHASRSVRKYGCLRHLQFYPESTKEKERTYSGIPMGEGSVLFDMVPKVGQPVVLHI
jgi:hypothetical protein